MWTIIDLVEKEQNNLTIDQASLVEVTIENEYGYIQQFEVAKNWLIFQDYKIGDEWEEAMEEDIASFTIMEQSNLMNRYYDELDSL